MEITSNTVVSFHYTGSLKDKSVFDSSKGREPLSVIVGSGMIIPGLEKGLMGMKVGDKKKISITAEDAYGQRQENAMQEVPKDQMPKDAELKVGMQLLAQGPYGAIPVTVIEITKDKVKLDFNHPLAGKDLIFDVEITEVREPTKEELEHGHVHGEGGHHHH